MTVDLLIDINNMKTGSNNITLSKVNVKPYGNDKMYMNKDLIADKLDQLIDQLNEGKIDPQDFYLELLNNIHPFYDGNGRNCKILFASLQKGNKQEN